MFYLKDVPAPILVGLVSSDVVEIPETFNGFGPQEVMSIVGLDVEVGRRVRGHVEVRDLGSEVGGLPGKGQVTGVGQLLGELKKQIFVLKRNKHFIGCVLPTH